MSEVKSRAEAVARWIAGTVAALAAVTALWFVAQRPPSTGEVLRKVIATDENLRPKVCAHRCNNIPMYRFAWKHFECIEIDVHVTPKAGGSAGVYHPPDRNFHGLTLDFLLAREKLPRGTLWLDTKDLSPVNWRGYLEQLRRLIPASRRRDVIVETVWATPDVGDAAAAFRSSEFQFSYYLPTDLAARCGALATPECLAFRNEVLATLESGFSHLSFDAAAFPFVQAIQGGLPPSVKLLTWDLSREWPKRELFEAVDIYIVNLPNFYLN